VPKPTRVRGPSKSLKVPVQRRWTGRRLGIIGIALVIVVLAGTAWHFRNQPPPVIEPAPPVVLP